MHTQPPVGLITACMIITRMTGFLTVRSFMEIHSVCEKTGSDAEAQLPKE